MCRTVRNVDVVLVLEPSIWTLAFAVVHATANVGISRLTLGYSSTQIGSEYSDAVEIVATNAL